MKGVTFNSGETLPELRMHFRTNVAPDREARGVVRNAVLIMHGRLLEASQ